MISRCINCTQIKNLKLIGWILTTFWIPWPLAWTKSRKSELANDLEKRELTQPTSNAVQFIRFEMISKNYIIRFGELWKKCVGKSSFWNQNDTLSVYQTHFAFRLVWVSVSLHQIYHELSGDEIASKKIERYHLIDFDCLERPKHAFEPKSATSARMPTFNGFITNFGTVSPPGLVYPYLVSSVVKYSHW